MTAQSAVRQEDWMPLPVFVSRLLAAVLLTVGAVAPAFADLLPVQQGAVTYISGGIGADEIEIMKSSIGAYNLLVSNSEKDGSFTAGIDITIRDGHGRVVLNAKDTGPLLYVKLPLGDYTLDALYHGVENVRDVTIGPKRPNEANFIWPVLGG
jgi:hypothetical protein